MIQFSISSFSFMAVSFHINSLRSFPSLLLSINMLYSCYKNPIELLFDHAPVDEPWGLYKTIEENQNPLLESNVLPSRKLTLLVWKISIFFGKTHYFDWAIFNRGVELTYGIYLVLVVWNMNSMFHGGNP